MGKCQNNRCLFSDELLFLIIVPICSPRIYIYIYRYRFSTFWNVLFSLWYFTLKEYYKYEEKKNHTDVDILMSEHSKSTHVKYGSQIRTLKYPCWYKTVYNWNQFMYDALSNLLIIFLIQGIVYPLEHRLQTDL